MFRCLLKSVLRNSRVSGVFHAVLALVLVVLPSVVLAAEEGGHGEAHHGNPGPGLKLIFQEINFLILIGLLYFLLRKPIKEFFAARALSIGKDVTASRLAYEKAMEENREIAQRLQKADSEASALMRDMKEQGEALKGRILEQASQSLVRMKDDAKRIIDSELTKANEELKEVTAKLVKELAINMVQNELKPQDEDRLTKNYLDQVRGS